MQKAGQGIRGVAQPGSALAWGARGRWFESSHPDWTEGHFERSGLLNLAYLATFYILYSAALDRYYVGHTTEALEGRLLKHPSAHQRWTGCAKDWRVVYHEVHDDKFAAYRRELEVKR